MTKPQTVLELARHSAQELHKKISANISQAERASWADVKLVQAEITALGSRMKSLAEAESDAAKTGIKVAIAKLEAAGELVEDKAVAARDGVRDANVQMLESVHGAANSLSAAVAAARTTLAHAIEPKKVVA